MLTVGSASQLLDSLHFKTKLKQFYCLSRDIWNCRVISEFLCI